MFDIGFSEVLLIFVIALVVLGPEKLPRLASQVGRWIGRARAMARQFREQLEEEVNLEQVRRAHEAKPQTPVEPEPPSSAAASTAASGATGGHDAGGPTSPAAHGAETGQPQGGDAGGYRGPDPADFRADTFSHAHPTDEFGANPHTASGAAEPEPASAATDTTASEANVAAAQAEVPAERPQHVQSGQAYASNTPPAAAPGVRETVTAEPAARRPATEETDSHGHS